MNDLPENELLSAYLDGELTAAERAEVERLLAANPAARQLLDELRTLRATLRALPPRKLGEDLSRQVLREAQRRMLTEGEPGERETFVRAARAAGAVGLPTLRQSADRGLAGPDRSHRRHDHDQRAATSHLAGGQQRPRAGPGAGRT